MECHCENALQERETVIVSLTHSEYFGRSIIAYRHIVPLDSLGRSALLTKCCMTFQIQEAPHSHTLSMELV